MEDGSMIDLLTSMPVPLILAVVGIYALGKRVNVYEGLICGAGEGVKTLARIAHGRS